MKKALALLLAVLMLCTVLAACGKSEPTPAAPAESDAPAGDAPASAAPTDGAKKRVLFCTMSLEGGLSIFDDLLRPEVESYGYEYDCISCDGDAVKQIEQVENGVAQGYDLIYLWPVTGEALSDACAHAIDDGVLVYVFLNDTKNYSVLFCDDAAGNGKLLGEMSLQWVSETFPDAEDGSVNAAILGASNDNYNIELSKAVREVIHADPRINVLEDYDIEYSTSAAQAAAENVMTMHPDKQINLWVGIAAILTDGIDAALMAENSGAGDLSKVGLIIPGPMSPEYVEKLELGHENKAAFRGLMCTGGDLAENFKSMGAEIDMLLRGESVPSVHYSPIEAVWYEDLASYGY